MTELGRCVLIDRYAQKDLDRTTGITEGRLVVVQTDSYGTRGIGRIKKVLGRSVTVELKDGEITVDRDAVDIPLETTPEEIWNRTAKHLASQEEDVEFWYKRFYKALDNFRFVPGGRILAWAGTDQSLTAFNCFVSSNIKDTVEGIYDNLLFMVETMSRGGGVGIQLGTIRPKIVGTKRSPQEDYSHLDIIVPDSREGIVRSLRRMASSIADGHSVTIDFSSLRPKNAPVLGVNGRSSGAASWARLALEIAEIMNGSVPQGRLTIRIEAHHPDLPDFVEHVIPKMEELGISCQIRGKIAKRGSVHLVFPDREDPEYCNYRGDLESWTGKVVEYRTLTEEEYRSLIERARSCKFRKRAANKKINPSGAVEWGRIFSFTTGLIEQGGSRRGALMLMLPDWHPEIRKFINYKREAGRLTNANISVCVSDDFLEAVEADADWSLVYPDVKHPEYDTKWNGSVKDWKEAELPVIEYERMKARELWREISEAAWASAEPGVWFVDRALADSNSYFYEEGRIIATNPCFPASELVLTSDGLETVGKLFEEGEEVEVLVDSRLSDTNTQLASSVFKTRESTIVWELETEEGFSVRATANHKFQTDEGWKELSSLCTGEKIHLLEIKAPKVLCSDEEVSLTEYFASASFNEIDQCIEIEWNQETQLELLRFGVLSVREGNHLQIWKGTKQLIEWNVLPEIISAVAQINDYQERQTGYYATVKSVRWSGEEDVYCLTEPVTHSWNVGGFVVSNCGEQSLPGNSVCLLGALNLPSFVNGEIGEGEVDWTLLAETVETAVRMLDNVIDITPYHDARVEAQQKGERRIGLGVMGLAELLIRCGIRYGSSDSLQFVDTLMDFIKTAAYDTSVELAEEKGMFPFCIPQLLAESGFISRLSDDLKADISQFGLRNVTLLTCAPTGTTSSLVGTSSGIEPFFSFEWMRKSRIGSHKEVMRVLEEWREKNPDQEKLPDYFVTAMELTPDEHAQMQAVIQRHIDSSVSKTGNLPSDYTIEQVGEYFTGLYKYGAKGGTVYRDKSREEQVLNIISEEEKCPKCHGENLHNEGRCTTCQDCGWSKCTL